MAGTTLGTAYVQIVPSAQGIKGAISGLLGGEADSAGKAAGGKLGASLKKAVIAAGVGTALVATIKGAVSEGAKLQQSYLGGLDTLYGDAAGAAREYARAASEAGISMNTFSEQAVSFGAALKKAYGGDATKAIEAANMAILDMADNSAKMGTDITSVQQAYQSFARGQYVLLDNLKLGYGGTRSEMQRLLKDAEAITGVEYDIDNLGDVYNAIHVIQEDLGLTGVAAAEAATTFSGSFNAMKAAAQNFLGSLALGENVTESLGTLITSFSTFFFNNMLPMIGTILKALPGAIFTFLQQGVPLLLSNIATLISTLSTQIASVANSVTADKVTAWVSTTLPKLVSAAGQMIGKFAATLLIHLPKIVAAIGKIGLAIVTGLGSAIWAKVTAAANGIKDRFMQPINTMKDKVKGILDKIKNFFPINLGKILHFSLPKISVSGGAAPWGIGGKGTKPSFSVTWSKHALGGIISKRLLMTEGSTVHEFGEAGSEAILPLNPFWKKMDEFANSIQGGGITINVYATPSMDVKQLASEVEKKLIESQNRRRLAWQ